MGGVNSARLKLSAVELSEYRIKLVRASFILLNERLGTKRRIQRSMALIGLSIRSHGTSRLKKIYASGSVVYPSCLRHSVYI